MRSMKYFILFMLCMFTCSSVSLANCRRILRGDDIVLPSQAEVDDQGRTDESDHDLAIASLQKQFGVTTLESAWDSGEPTYFYRFHAVEFEGDYPIQLLKRFRSKPDAVPVGIAENGTLIWRKKH